VLSYRQKTTFEVMAIRYLEFWKFLYWLSVTVTAFQICICVPGFVKVRFFLVEILWRFHDFQNGGSPPSWILEVNNGFLAKPYVGSCTIVNRDHSSELLSFQNIACFVRRLATNKRTDGLLNRCIKTSRALVISKQKQNVHMQSGISVTRFY